MRRKSERTASKKTKSPEKKLEKVKRTRTRRRKQSTSSDNESGDESSPVKIAETLNEVEKKPPVTPVKEDSPEDAHDQVWQVKTAESSGDVGEIQKLKICLTRPPSTPERVDRSPRSKRKHSRATSSSDTPSNEGEGDRKKNKHRAKRSVRESKDDDKNQDSQEEAEPESESQQCKDKSDNEISQSSDKVSETVPDDTPMSTTNEEVKSSDNIEKSKDSTDHEKEPDTPKDVGIEESKKSDADTTVASPKVETTVVSTEIETIDDNANKSTEEQSEDQSRDTSEDKSEVLDIHDDDNRCESSDMEGNKSQREGLKQGAQSPVAVSQNQDQEMEASKDEVSKTEDKSENLTKETECDSNDANKSSDESHVVESSKQKINNEDVVKKITENSKISEESNITDNKGHHQLDSTHSKAEDQGQNGSTAPIVISRKRRWGTRATKIQTQKSITISTDVLKDIIPDVQPVEFDEVIEEKKSKREVSEKIERPVLPKIVIDNTESIEVNKKSDEENIREVKPRDSQLTANRKISIVKDNDSIIARPPSPPRNKQSCILFITNLVRPFTLPQLKNLLQRTGKIVEDGFWIDKIKSKCFVKYETEDQAFETRHALHGVTWPVSNPKTLQVDFSNDEAFEKARANEETDNAKVSTIPGTVEDWLREQDMKRERGEMEKPYERKMAMREWDVGKNEKDKDKLRRPDERMLEKRRNRTPERSPEPARKFKKKEEEAPAKLLDDLFRKTKTTPCIYWLPLSQETIAIKEEQRRQHMAEHERRLQEIRRTHRRH